MAGPWRDIPYNLNAKRVWIAGHTGMVGSALYWRLQLENCDILTVSHDDLDLRDQAAVRDWGRRNKPDVIIIAAAKVGGIMANATYPASFFYGNIMITTNILHSAYEVGVDRVLNLGSSCIYPKNCGQPIQESALLSGALEETNEAYALAKIAGLKMASYYRAQYGCDFISAMPCNLYGVGDRYDEQQSHVIPAMIMKAHKAKVQNAAELVLWGSGAPMREFLYVDDLADALVLLLQSYNGEAHVNVGSGEEIEIKKLSKIVCEVVGFKGKVVFDNTKPDGARRKVLDNSMLMGVGWKPKMCLKDGISKCYEDYKGRNYGCGSNSENYTGVVGGL